MTIETYLALLIFITVGIVTPGPNNLMLITSGVNFGFLRTVPHMAGITLGFMLMVGLVGVGLAEFFDAFPTSYLVLKILAVIYLLWLALKIASTRQIGSSKGATSGRPLTFLQAAAFQWVNPKAWSLALTAVAVYAPANAPLWVFGLISLTFGLINVPSTSLWALLGQQMRQLLSTPARIRAFNVSAALLLVASLYPILLPA